MPRTKMPKVKRTRTKRHEVTEETPIKRTRTRTKTILDSPKKLTKCPKEYPCGGCTPNPPADCAFKTDSSFCGAPCIDIVNCAYKCKDISCEAFKTTRTLLKLRHLKDVKKFEEKHAPKETKKKKQEEAPIKRTRTRTKRHEEEAPVIRKRTRTK